MESWRLIIHDAADAFTNMAIDDVLIHGHKPTLRFYKWNPSAISIGYFQSIVEEVNLSECKIRNVDVVRRITGGGAVYHDKNGEITYSIVLPANTISEDILESYKKICNAITRGLNLVGINAMHAGINDIVVNGKKISGSAQTRRYGNVLQHGTILLEVNVKTMFSLLKVDIKKISDKDIKKVEDRVTSIHKEVGKFDQTTIIQNIVEGFSKEFDVLFLIEQLNNEEKKLIKEKRGRYASKEWNFQR